jgi:Stigma-specific protein, Stig1
MTGDAWKVRLAGALAVAALAACSDKAPAVTAADAMVEASADAVVEASVDAVVEASVDAAVEASVDAVVEASVDASVDAVVEASVDAMVEASVDTMVEASVDAAVEASVDAMVEASVDATPDATGDTATDATCATGQTACGGACVDLMTAPSNCGACGVVCRSGILCIAGVCMAGCRTGLTECGGVCRDFMTDDSNCGACGRACPTGQMCSMGVCAITCGPGLTVCSGACVNTQTDNAHCGMCGNACPAVASGTSACTAGACRITCATGAGDCDMMAANGCEARLASDPRNCGGCGVVCAAGSLCAGGACVTPGSTPASAGTSCLNLRSLGVTVTGAYWVNPGSGPVRVWCEMVRGGGGFMLVARLAGSGDMPPWDFDLQPNRSSGTYVPDLSVDANFYMNWSAFSYSEFLFSTVDRAVWLVTNKSNFDVIYANDPRVVSASSGSASPTSYRWYNRGPINPEDPWVSVDDHVGQILYGEASWPGCSGTCGVPHHTTKNTHGGVGVYVR